MPLKPRPTRVTRQGEVVPNEHATAAGKALQYSNVLLAMRAIELEHEDIASGNKMLNRYVRVRDRLISTMGCSKASAERAIREGKLIRTNRFLAELPQKGAELSIQLQRIADRHEEDEPAAAVAAIREIARINGLHAPKELTITQGDRGVVDDLRAVMDCLSERGRAALDIVLDELEEAKSSGRLALPDPDVIEGEIVGETGEAVEEGGAAHAGDDGDDTPGPAG